MNSALTEGSAMHPTAASHLAAIALPPTEPIDIAALIALNADAD